MRRGGASARAARLPWTSLTGLCLAMGCAPLAGETPDGDRDGASPRVVSADPVDLSGLWVISNRSLRGNRDEALEPLAPEAYLTPAALAAVASARPELDPSARCLPALPRQLAGPYPIEIVQRPGRIAQLFEWDTVFRVIYTDGRDHPDPDADTRFLGHAVGTWEGETLRVETTNFNGKTWLEGGGAPLSEHARLTEWYALREDGQTLEVRLRIEDPENLTRPIWRKHLYNLRNDWELKEYVCAEGNRDNIFQPVEDQPGAFGASEAAP